MPQDRAARRTQLGNELVLGNLFPGVSELGACVRTRGATFLWFAAGSVLGFELSKGGVGRGWGGHESLADEKPSPPPLCKLKQLSCLSCQCLLLNLGSKGGGREGGREGGTRTVLGLHHQARLLERSWGPRTQRRGQHRLGEADEETVKGDLRGAAPSEVTPKGMEGKVPAAGSFLIRFHAPSPSSIVFLEAGSPVPCRHRTLLIYNHCYEEEARRSGVSPDSPRLGRKKSLSPKSKNIIKSL